MPGESFVYLGDTARLPYGTKSPQTVRRYAEQAAAHLVARDVKMIVIACNTASAVAVEHLRARLTPVPVLGVIVPGARALCAATTTKKVFAAGRCFFFFSLSLSLPPPLSHSLSFSLLFSLSLFLSLPLSSSFSLSLFSYLFFTLISNMNMLFLTNKINK